jgi:hypothetical protein
MEMKGGRVIERLIVFRRAQDISYGIGWYHFEVVIELPLHHLALAGKAVGIVISEHAHLAVDALVIRHTKAVDIPFDDAHALDRKPMQRLCPLMSHHACDIGVTGCVAWTDEASIAARRPPPDALGLQNHYRTACPCQIESCC